MPKIYLSSLGMSSMLFPYFARSVHLSVHPVPILQSSASPPASAIPGTFLFIASKQINSGLAYDFLSVSPLVENSPPFGLRPILYGYRLQFLQIHSLTSLNCPQQQSKHLARIAFIGVNAIFVSPLCMIPGGLTSAPPWQNMKMC